MKRIRLLLIALAALLLLWVAAALKRVPAGSEGLRVARDGGVEVLPPGWHLVGPRARLIRYPSGDHAFRVPEDGAAFVIFQGGDSLAVAFEFDLTFPPGASEILYREFSQDFDAAFAKLVVSAAEIEAASRP